MGVKSTLRRLERGFIRCPDCESSEISYNGKSPNGTQKYLCKACKYQFVNQFDALFPRSSRNMLFEEEFLSNMKPYGSQKGTGREMYYAGARLETLLYIESQRMKVQINKLIKRTPIQENLDYKLLVEFIVHEAYIHTMRG